MNENKSGSVKPPKPKKTISCFTLFAILLGIFFLMKLLSDCSVNRNTIMLESPKSIYKVEEIDEMKRIATFRLFADHYQFFFCDPDRLNFDSMLNVLVRATQADWERGWIKADSAIVLFTFQDANDHRIDIFVGKEYDGHGNARQVFVFPFQFSRGQMDIMSIMDSSGSRVQVPSGDYSVYVRLFNPGKATEDYINDDKEFLVRDDIERYEIVLVPGKPDKEGVIFGPEKRSDVEREIYPPPPP